MKSIDKNHSLDLYEQAWTVTGVLKVWCIGDTSVYTLKRIDVLIVGLAARPACCVHACTSTLKQIESG